MIGIKFRGWDLGSGFVIVAKLTGRKFLSLATVTLNCNISGKWRPVAKARGYAYAQIEYVSVGYVRISQKICAYDTFRSVR